LIFSLLSLSLPPSPYQKHNLSLFSSLHLLFAVESFFWSGFFISDRNHHCYVSVAGENERGERRGEKGKTNLFVSVKEWLP